MGNRPGLIYKRYRPIAANLVGKQMVTRGVAMEGGFFMNMNTEVEFELSFTYLELEFA